MNSSGPSSSGIAIRQIPPRAGASWQGQKPASAPRPKRGDDDAAEHDFAPESDGKGKLVDKLA